MSFFLLAPVTFFAEGVKVTPAFLEAAVSIFLVAFYISLLFLLSHYNA
jgi:hypothetical protein